MGDNQTLKYNIITSKIGRKLKIRASYLLGQKKKKKKTIIFYCESYVAHELTSNYNKILLERINERTTGNFYKFPY